MHNKDRIAEEEFGGRIRAMRERIDGALHLVSRLCGIESARAVAKYMEYDRWKEDAGLVVQR